MVRMGRACSVIPISIVHCPHFAIFCFHQASAATGAVLRIVGCQAGDTGTDDSGSVVCMVSFPSTSSRSEEHTSELQSLMRISYAVFCLKKKKHKQTIRLHKYKYNT